MSDQNIPPSTSTSSSNSRPIRRVKMNVWVSIQTVLGVAIVVATVLTMWTPANLFSNQLMENMLWAMQNNNQPQAGNFPTVTPPPHQRIGLVAGHWGNNNDPGAVCADGITEVDTNMKIAALVQQNLMIEGYDVDLLQEFDKRLFQYQGLVLVSIHNDSCQYLGDDKTGFKVAAAKSTLQPEKANRLAACLTSRYGKITGLPFHANTVTRDMTDYHTFDEVNSNTPAAIIEAGFLNMDKEILTKHTDLIAKGITSGILCYIRNEQIDIQPQPTP